MAAERRSLYHLAPTQSPSPQIRKQLVQGRLETQLSPARGASCESNAPKGYVPAEYQPKTGSPHKTDTLTSHRSTESHCQSELLAEQEDPRMNPPSQYTKPGQNIPVVSPQAVEPSSSLSLSENDDSSSPVDTQHKPSSIHIMDGNGHPSQTAVPVVISTATSPVKVVCHSPRRREPGTEAVSGYTDRASRVEVPGVARVMVTDPKHQTNQPYPPEGNTSEDSFDNVHTIAGSPVDPNSSAIRVALDDNDKENGVQPLPYNPNQYKSFMGDLDHAQGGPLSATLNQSNIRQQLFDYSDTSLAVQPTNAKTTSITDEKKKKKKPPSRVIPSRYMESKKTNVVPKTSKKSSSFGATRKVSFQTKTYRAASSLSNNSLLDTTAHNRNTSTKGTKIVTSTPANGSIGVLPGHAGGGMPEPTPILPPKAAADGCDHVDQGVKGMSSIKMAAESLAKQGEKSKKKIKIKAPMLPQKHGHHTAKQKHEYGQGEVSQRQLELEYARMMQWIFLESKLKSTVSQQEKDAQAQLYSMWKENDKLRGEMTKLQLEVDEKNHMEELDKQLDLQLTGLKPIGTNLPKLFIQYDQVSSALNTTCQYMPVNDVMVPGNHEELLVALTESERLLGEIDGLTRHQTHKISQFSKEMDVLAKVTESEVKEQGRCQELLAAASTLGTQERSLQAQTILRSYPAHYLSDDHSL